MHSKDLTFVIPTYRLREVAVGLNVMLPNYGKGNNVFIFAGYETMDTPNDAHFAGRLSFVRNF